MSLSHLACVSHHTEHFTYIDAFNLYNHLTRYYGAPYFTDEKTEVEKLPEVILLLRSRAGVKMESVVVTTIPSPFSL